MSPVGRGLDNIAYFLFLGTCTAHTIVWLMIIREIAICSIMRSTITPGRQGCHEVHLLFCSLGETYIGCSRNLIDNYKCTVYMDFNFSY